MSTGVIVVSTAEQKKQELAKLADELIEPIEDEDLKAFLRWVNRINLMSEGFLGDDAFDVLWDMAELGLFRLSEYRVAMFFILQMSMNDPLRIAFERGWHAQKSYRPVDLSQIEVRPYRPPRPGPGTPGRAGRG